MFIEQKLLYVSISDRKNAVIFCEDYLRNGLLHNGKSIAMAWGLVV